MKYLLNVLALGLVLLFSSCSLDPNQQVDEGIVRGEKYSSEEIGWTIDIPHGWRIASKDQMEGHTENGAELVEEMGVDLDYSGLKHLIAFQKDQFNLFQSTSEPFELEYEGEYEENNAAIKEMLYDMYLSQGIRVDSSSTKMNVNGLDFHGFHLIVYAPNGDVILNQDMYSRHINGFDFSVNLNYNSEENKEKRGHLHLPWF